ncbi:PE-PGRS family protein [Lacihabitans sp. LS3-19]|uniref:PE-PGRS family protein n=1 Tax=Lacihabitans sp. LS3-19 TaxID=2487335 RepID=UPI0020CF52B1|nr:PE-PGRS family protein [Lacihabitans sp. LS3-19]
MKKIFGLFVLSVGLNSCFLFGDGGGGTVDPIDSTAILPSFNANPQIFDTPANKTNEASGIAPSHSFPGQLFVHDDSQAKPGLHIFSSTGAYLRFVNFAGNNRDWEDIATGVGPIEGVNYVYAADIGDNNGDFNEYYIYRFPEPDANQKDINDFETIIYHYPNKQTINAETLLLDPKTKDLYVITKDEFNVKVFLLKYPQPVNTSFEAQFLGTIPYWGITAGDISTSGDEILLKTYLAAFYWKLKKGETIFQAISRTRDIGLPYIQEPQGEAICWDINAKGYFTISERAEQAAVPKLYYYSKK